MEVEDFIQLAWHILTGPTSPTQSVAVLALSTITTEAINREPQEVSTGATDALTATDHGTAHPRGGASIQIMAPNFPTSSIGQVPRQLSEATGNTQKIAQYFDDSCIAVVVPCVAFLGFLSPPKRG